MQSFGQIKGSDFNYKWLKMKPYGIMMSQVPSQQECTEVKKPCTALTDESSPHFISGVVCREKTKQGPNSIEFFFS